jgi:hypothetical protein
MRALHTASGVVAVLIIMFILINMRGNASADDRRHQWLTEISIIDSVRQKLIAGNLSYYPQSPSNETAGFGFYIPQNSSIVYNNSAVATEHVINTLIGTLKPLSSNVKIKAGIYDAIQALKIRDANKALLVLNQARNEVNRQLANIAILRSNSTLPSNNTNST